MHEIKTRKIEIDEHNGAGIHVRETTHLVDDDTGEIVHDSVKHHRFVIECDDDVKAAEEGLTEIANLAWTPELRQKAKDRKAKEKGDKV